MAQKKKTNKITLRVEMDMDKPDEAAAFRLSQVLKPEAIEHAVKPMLIRKLNALGKQILDSCSASPQSEVAENPEP